VTIDGKKPRARHVASDEAHAWARSLKLNNPNAKTVLRALALYVNGEGSCFVGLDQLSEDTDLSPDTVRRRLVWLEQIGAILRLAPWLDENGRRNAQGRGKRTTDEIRLLLAADIDEIERLARGAGEPNPSTETTEFSPSREQGLNDDQDSVSPRLAPRQPSQSCDHLISEPEPEESPPNPPPGGAGLENQEKKESEAAEPAHFAFFKAAYPDRERWAWPKALTIYRSLSEFEQSRAAAASPEYAKLIAATKRKPPPVKPERFLRERLFENFPHARLPQPPKVLPPNVFYPEGSEAFSAMKAAFTIARTIEFRPCWEPENRIRRGVMIRGELDQDFLALAAYVDGDSETWADIAVEGTPEFAKWRDKLHAWTGYKPEARKIWTEPHDPAVHDLPLTHALHRFRKHVLGLRVPAPFPPSATGKLYAAATGPPFVEGTLMTDDDMQEQI